MNRAIGGIALAAVAAVLTVVCSLRALQVANNRFAPPELFGDPETDAAFVAAAFMLASATVAHAAAWPSRGAVSVAVLTIGWCAVVPAIWSDSASVRFVATAAAALVPAAVFHLAWSLSWYRPSRLAAGLVVAAGYAAMAGLSVTRLLTTDPRLDLGCVVGCDAPAWNVASLPALSRGLGVALLVTAGVLAAAAGTIAVRMLLHERSAATRATLGALALCAVAEIVWVAIPGARPLGGPPLWLVPWLFAARAVAYGLLGIALTWKAAIRWRTHRDLRRTASELVAATPPRGLRAALATGVRDAGLRLAFRTPSGWVDEDGAAVTWPDGPYGAPAATIERNGSTLAAVGLSGGDLEGSGLATLLGPAALLAVDVERTRAHALAELTALRTARQRVVESADAARRQAERDVHDGAQQRLIAASFELLQAADAARAGSDPCRAAHFERLRGEVLEALAELRAVAHGVYPATLADAGLVPALEALARHSPARLVLSSPALGRLATPVEHTAYLAITEAAHEATSVDVRLEVGEGSLRVRIGGAASGPGLGVEDRVVALGGKIERDGEDWMLEVPCAS